MKPIERLLLLLVAAAALVGLAMTFTSGATSEHDVLAETAADAAGPGLDPALATALAASMEQLFGGYKQPKLPEGGMPGVTSEQELRSGRSGYAVKCTQCHGVTGAADTGTAALLKPRPRSFRLGKIKFTSTAAGQPPVLADLERVIRDGVPTTSMAGFPTLPENARRELAGYAQYLLMRGATELAALERIEAGGLAAEQMSAVVAEEYAAVRAAWAAAVPADPPIPETPRGDAAHARAEELFAESACLSCHGADGSGKGPVAFAGGKWLLRDEWGDEARPRAFSEGRWFGGSAPEDLYRRIAFGVKGTPMPPLAGALAPEEIWALVHYVLDFAKEGQR